MLLERNAVDSRLSQFIRTFESALFNGYVPSDEFLLNTFQKYHEEFVKQQAEGKLKINNEKIER